MTALIFATMQEARPFLKRLHVKKIARRPYRTFLHTGTDALPAGLILISGIGKTRSMAATEHLIARHGVTAVLNVGVSGALTDEIQPGELFVVNEVVDGDAILAGATPDARSCRADQWPDLPRKRVASVTVPVFEHDRRAILGLHSDLVDMEADGIAETCQRHGVPFYCIKGVTDLAGPGNRMDLLRNIRSVSARLADLVAGTPTEEAGMLKNFHRFTRIEHSLFSLPLLFAGAWLGSGGQLPSWQALGLIALAGVGARSFGMALNRILDRDLDARNERTASRELPSGRMSVVQAYSIAVTGLAGYLLACAGLGRVCLYLAPVPILPLAGYSLLKRFTCFCHFGIGLCLALAPLGAFVAVSGGLDFSMEIMLLALFTFCWISGFDIIYSLQDIRSDRQVGVRSLPAQLGSNGAQVVAASVHVVAATAITALWWLVGGSALSGIALAVTVAALAAGYVPWIPLPARFFPTSAIASIAASFVPLLS